MLDKQGYEVRAVTNGKMALRSAINNPPDVILLDIMMPEMNGYEVCKNLKENEKTCHIPVIFLSALNEVFDKVKAFEVGGIDYITKPFEEQEVFIRLKNQIQLRRQQLLLEAEIIKRKETERLLIQTNQKLEEIVRQDGLTGVANRYFFDETLSQEWRRSQRKKTYLALILCDIDFFKNYNDYYGHLKGDECLVLVAKIISNCVKRPADLVSRYGGEEFGIILPDTNIEGAKEVGQSLINSLKIAKLIHEKSEIKPYITVSLGIVSIIPNSNLSAKDLINFADQALYQSKHQGRDRLTIYEYNNN
jgi:diguanylate cyclase (GGDEF)-like protein